MVQPNTIFSIESEGEWTFCC